MVPLLVIALVVVLGALAWWVSGRSRPLERVDDAARRRYAEQNARNEVTAVREPPSRAGF